METDLKTSIQDDIKLGFWIRPDPILYGTRYESIACIKGYDKLAHSWMTKCKTDELSSPSNHLITDNVKSSEWTITNLSKAECDRLYGKNNDSVKIYARSSICALLNHTKLYDMSFIRLYDGNAAIFKTYSSNDTVWLAQLLTLGPSHQEFNTLALWLDDYHEDDDGNCIWTDSNSKTCKLSILPKKANWYETSQATVCIPKMNISEKSILIFRSAMQIMVSHNINEFNTESSYVMLTAVDRKLFIEMKIKDSMWNVYAYYRKEHPYDIYPEIPHFPINTIA